MTIHFPRWLLAILGFFLITGVAFWIADRLLFPETVLIDSTNPTGMAAIVVKQVGYSGDAAYRCEFYQYQGKNRWYRQLISSQLIRGESLSCSEAKVSWNNRGATVSLIGGPQIELREGFWINPNPHD